MQLSDIVQPDCIKVPLEQTEKRAAINELIDLLAATSRVGDPEELKEAVWEQEATRTTGIGHGLAIPHGKSRSCDRLVLAIGKPAEPIDFQAIDGRPVRVVFLLASPPDQTGPHIQALAQISRLMTNEAFRRAILDAADAQSIYALIAQQDGVAVE